LLDRVGVREVRLQDEAGAEREELRLSEHLAERADRQIEIAIFLHVEVDGLGRDPALGMAIVVGGGCAVEDAQPLLDQLDGVPKCDQVDLAHD